MGTMAKRVVFGILMLAFTVGILWWDHRLEQTGCVVGLLLAGLLAVVLAVGVVEFARLAGGAGLPVLRPAAVVGALAVAILPVWRQVWPVGAAGEDLVLLVAAGTVLIVFLWQMVAHRLDQPIQRVAGTLAAVAYLGAPAGCLLAIRVGSGIPVLVLFLAAVKLTDIGAYFTGSWIGRHKLIPWLSPGKSWEGLVGGLVAAVLVTGLLNWILGGESRTIMDTWWAGLFALVTGLAGQFGDLCESLLKRGAKLKDSGALVPEFGGMLDILDSPLIAAPVAYVMLLVLMR